MNTIRKNKGLMVLISSVVFVYLVFVYLVFVGFTSKNDVTKNLKFSSVNPGQTTEKAVIETFGKPQITESAQGGKTLFYNSSAIYQYDRVWSKNGVIIAVREVLPEKTKVSEIKNNFGNPEDTLYDTDLPDDTWLVYYQKGLAFKTAGDNAYFVVKFGSQAKNSFLKNIAPLVGITLQKQQYQGEPFNPAP